MVIDPYTAAALAKSSAGKIVNKWLEPTLAKLSSEFSQAFDLTIHDYFVNAFNDYLSSSFEKQSYMTTIALPNQKKMLKELYVPATLVAPDNAQTKIDKYPIELATQHKDILIVDTAGMGKSTVIKFMFLEAIEQNLGIPILVEMRKLSKEKNLLNFILQELTSIHHIINEKLVLNLIEEGDFIFFLDGYDEIASDDRELVTADLQSFKKKASGNRFVMSSRDEAGLVAFPEFMRFNLRAFTEEEAYELIGNYILN